MSLYITQICDFRNILRILRNISCDSLFIFEKDQLVLQSSDVFNNIFVKVNIKKEYFKFYKETKNINVNVINLYQILLSSNRFNDVSFEIIKNNMNITIIDNKIEKKILFPLNLKSIDINSRMYVNNKSTFDPDVKMPKGIIAKSFISFYPFFHGSSYFWT